MSAQKAEKCVPPKHSGLTRIVKAGGYSFKGMYTAWQSEAAFRQECMLTFALDPGFRADGMMANHCCILKAE